MKKIYVLLLLVLIGLFSFGQTTIYSEDFTGQNGKGAVGPTPTTDLTGVDWTIDISSVTLSASSDWFRVQSELFEARDIDGEGIWLSPLIDISAYTNVSFSLDAGERGTMEGTDVFITEYRIDGGSWIQASTNGSLNDDFTSAVVSQLALSGDDLEIRVKMNNGAGSEYHELDNILVEGDLVGGGCTAPTTQASTYNTTSIGTTTATLNWTSGNGDEVLVVVKEGSAVDTDPTDGTTYTGNTVFTSGTQIGTGNYAVLAGTTASSVSITGLNPATTYHVAIYEYNILDTCYELTELTGNFTTDCSIPSDVTAFTATAGNTTVDLSWANGSCFDEILVVAKATSAVTVSPSGDGTAYTANADFGSGTDLGGSEFAVFKGSGTSVTITGLTNGTTYHFTAFARKTASWSTGVSNSATPADIPSTGDIVISEIMYNSSGTDDEWVEIYNASGADITLNSDWRLTYGSSTFDFGGTIITDGSYLTIALGSNGDGTFNNDNPFTPDVSVIATPAATTNDSNNLVNSTATIAIVFEPVGSNVTIDTVTYDDGSPWPTNPDGDGPSLELIDVSSDNSLAVSWIDSDNDGGTPGSAHPRTFTFTGTWSPSDPNGVVTTTADILIVASGNATISTGTTCDTVTINPGASLTVNTAITLTTANGLTLESSSTSYSSLILDGTITGTVNYERHVNGNSGLGDTNAIGNNDLISPPLSGQSFGAFASANSNLLTNPGDSNEKAFAPFNKTTGEYENYFITTNAATTLDAGIGYRATTDDTATLTFTGLVNTGTVTNNIVNSGPTFADWNVIGNPYPSYLNVQDFLNYEVASGVKNLDLFVPATAAIYGYDGDAGAGGLSNYTIYNLANTTSTTVITPGQGFLVSADAANVAMYDVTFDPTMRATGITDDFIVGRGADAILNLELKITSLSDIFVTDFYFNENASLGLDPGYDAAIIGSAPNFALYSHLVEENTGSPFAIQAIGVSDLMNTTIALGVNANSDEQLVFTISESTLNNTVEIYLEDTLNNTSTLLNTSDYIITPSTNLNGTGRFYIRITDSTLSTPENSLDDLSIYSNNYDKTVVITGQLFEASTAKIYDIQGRVVSNTALLQNRNSSQTIDVSSLNAGIYVVQITNGTQSKTQKIIIR